MAIDQIVETWHKKEQVITLTGLSAPLFAWAFAAALGEAARFKNEFVFKLSRTHYISQFIDDTYYKDCVRIETFYQQEGGANGKISDGTGTAYFVAPHNPKSSKKLISVLEHAAANNRLIMMGGVYNEKKDEIRCREIFYRGQYLRLW